MPYFTPCNSLLPLISLPPISLYPTYIPSFLTLLEEYNKDLTSSIKYQRAIKKFKPQPPMLPLISYPIYSQPSILG